MFRLFRNLSRKWCCLGFQGNYEMAGERGFAVLVERDDRLGIRFLLQCRFVAQKDQSRIQITSTDVPISYVSETGMLFCPWCGANLRRVYGKRIAELDRPGLS